MAFVAACGGDEQPVGEPGESVTSPSLETYQGEDGAGTTTTGRPIADEVAAGAARSGPKGTAKITRVQCGVKRVPLAAVGPGGAAIDSVPRSGHQYCIVYGAVTNHTKQPIEYRPSLAFVELADGSRFGHRDDDPGGGHIPGVKQSDYSNPLNPGASAKYAEAFQVPVGKVPVAALEGDANRVSPDEPLVRWKLPAPKK